MLHHAFGFLLTHFLLKQIRKILKSPRKNLLVSPILLPLQSLPPRLHMISWWPLEPYPTSYIDLASSLWYIFLLGIFVCLYCVLIASVSNKSGNIDMILNYLNAVFSNKVFLNINFSVRLSIVPKIVVNNQVDLFNNISWSW